MKELLKELGWTQADLVRKLDCNPKTVQRWCQGENHKMAYRAVIHYLECKIRLEKIKETKDIEGLLEIAEEMLKGGVK